MTVPSFCPPNTRVGTCRWQQSCDGENGRQADPGPQRGRCSVGVDDPAAAHRVPQHRQPVRIDLGAHRARRGQPVQRRQQLLAARRVDSRWGCWSRCRPPRTRTRRATGPSRPLRSRHSARVPRHDRQRTPGALAGVRRVVDHPAAEPVPGRHARAARWRTGRGWPRSSRSSDPGRAAWTATPRHRPTPIGQKPARPRAAPRRAPAPRRQPTRRVRPAAAGSAPCRPLPRRPAPRASCLVASATASSSRHRIRLAVGCPAPDRMSSR